MLKLLRSTKTLPQPEMLTVALNLVKAQAAFFAKEMTERLMPANFVINNHKGNKETKIHPVVATMFETALSNRLGQMGWKHMWAMVKKAHMATAPSDFLLTGRKYIIK